MKRSPNRDDSRCLYCGRSREEVRKLILGVYVGICVECARLCASLQPKGDAGGQCLLCGKAAPATKVFHGVHGGVCVDCADLCLQILQSDKEAKA